MTDKDERITAWNAMAEKLLGMEKKDLFNKPVCDLYSPEEWKRMRGLNIRSKGMLSDIATRVLRKDGTFLDVNASISVIKDAQGNIIGSIGILHDMTREKMAEEQLRASENKLRIILDNSAAAITMTNPRNTRP